MSFSELGLSPVLCTPLARLGFTRPTPIQSQSIPLALEGRDLVARAQTGTGKTAAFGLPMIDRLLVREPRAREVRRPRGLVLVPTRELALQVYKAIETYGTVVGLRAMAVYGGAPMAGQVRDLRRGADIVVATPGRLIDHMQQRTIDLSGVDILTLDEADRMLDMGFMPALRRILAVLPQTRQTLLFSATLSSEVERLSTAVTRTPVRVDVSDGQVVASTVTHRVYPVGDGRKGDLLTHVLKQPPTGQALVFCRTKRGANRVGEHLERIGIRAAVIHGNKSQAVRNRALSDLKTKRVDVLVATDVAARGIDIEALPLVINFDLPLVAADYIHRVGRTGRAGMAGRAVSLVSPGERQLLNDIQRLLPTPIEQVIVDGFASSSSAAMEARPRAHRPSRRFRSTTGASRARRRGTVGHGASTAI